MERLPHELLLNILSFVGKEKVRRTIHAGGMQQQVPGFAIFDAGISVYTTPDWKVFDPSSSSKFGFLGMKCPHSKRGIKHHQIQTDFFRNKRHFYYAQVQGQLAVTGFPWCDFCVYLSDFNEFFFILITRKMSYYPNSTTYFSIMHFHLLSGKQKEPKAIQEPMKN